MMRKRVLRFTFAIVSACVLALGLAEQKAAGTGCNFPDAKQDSVF
jgi:hypothetical protein